MARIEYEQERKAHARLTFADCAARYIAQSRGKRSIDVIKWHVTLLRPTSETSNRSRFTMQHWSRS